MHFDEADRCSLRCKWDLRFAEGRADMRMEYEAGPYRTSWKSTHTAIPDHADLAATCWLAVIGLSLTVLVCAWGYADSIGGALAMSM
jgi:hypothetical protein